MPTPRRRAGDQDELRAGRPTVLIVDDVTDNLLAFEAMLRRGDIDIVTAGSGPGALEILLARPVALAIIDVQMPEMDGFALAELMQGVEKTRYVPIIFVTAGSRELSREFKGYQAGAVDFLFKPVDSYILRGKVEVFVTLERQRQRLREEDRLREMFIGILGHDLRNPLTGVCLAAESAMKRTGDAVVKESLDRVLRNSGRMARMIEQLLDLTRLRVGEGINLNAEDADLRRLVEQVLMEFEHVRARIQLTCEGDTHGAWDTDRILQVVSNLIGNAVEHSPQDAPIVVTVDGTRMDGVELDVHNGGPPIPDELRDVLFEPFRGSGRGRRGLGLGLYISNQLVLAHGGTLSFASTAETGTRFRVSLHRGIRLEQ